MLINVRGTHGSGKSTVVRKLLDAVLPAGLGDGARRPEAYH